MTAPLMSFSAFDRPLELKTHQPLTYMPVSTLAPFCLPILVFPLTMSFQFLVRVLPTVAKALGLAKEEGGAGGAPPGRR